MDQPKLKRVWIDTEVIDDSRCSKEYCCFYYIIVNGACIEIAMYEVKMTFHIIPPRNKNIRVPDCDCQDKSSSMLL